MKTNEILFLTKLMDDKDIILINAECNKLIIYVA